MFSCLICEKKFTTRSGLTGHSQTHKKIKPVEIVNCQICDRSFDRIVLRKNGQYVKLQTCSRKCGAQLRGNQKSNKVRDEAISKMIEVHGDRFDYSKVEYVDANTPITIGCDVHGFFETTYLRHIRSDHGCPQCGLSSRNDGLAQIGRDRTMSVETILERFDRKHGSTYQYPKIREEFNGIGWGFNRITITCKKHGDFMQHPSDHASGTGCPSCSKWVSHLEREWLDSIGLPDDSTHRQVWLSGHPVDGYDPSTNTIYMFHGSFWHGNPKIYKAEDQHPMLKKTFGELYERTLAIEEKLRSQGYTVISQWEH